MSVFQKIMNSEKPIIGMVHFPSLSGTPMNKPKPGKIVEHAIQEVKEP